MAEKVKVQCWGPVWSEKVGVGWWWISNRSGWLLELLTELTKDDQEFFTGSPYQASFSWATIICLALDDKLQDDSRWLTRKGRWLGLRCYDPTKPGCHPGWETILSWNCRKCRVAEIRPVDAKIAETPCLSLTDYKTDTFLHFRYQNWEERLAHPILFVLSIPKSFFYQRNGGIL